MPILSDLIISRGIDPSALDKHKRCDICRKNGPEILNDYRCCEEVCRKLWGDLAELHWKESEPVDGDSRGSIRSKLDPNRITRYLR